MAESLHILLGTAACLQWLCHSGERTVARGPLVSIKPCSASRGHSFTSVFMELYQKFFLMIFWPDMVNMDYAGSKTKSPGQISFKCFSPSGGHSFSSVFMKLYQNVCLYDFLFK